MASQFSKNCYHFYLQYFPVQFLFKISSLYTSNFKCQCKVATRIYSTHHFKKNFTIDPYEVLKNRLPYSENNDI